MFIIMVSKAPSKAVQTLRTTFLLLQKKNMNKNVLKEKEL